MQIPRSYIDGFADSLEKLSDEMKQRLADALSSINWDASVADVRNQLISIMQVYCGESADVASMLAAEFYDGLREYQVGEPLGAVATSGTYSDEAVDSFVRSAVQPLVDHGLDAVPEVIRAMTSRVGYETKSAAGETIFRNGERDSKRVRFARIPRGSKTYPHGCPFCQMLASRGFVYRNAKTAGEMNHFHADCQCMVVPGFGDNPKVEGYDPNEYLDRWQHPENYPSSSTEAPTDNAPQWARDLNVTVSERDVGLPSGRRGTSLRTATCDVYTTSDGIEVIFPQGTDFSKQDMTPRHAIELLERVPPEIRSNMQRQVFFVDYENPRDPYWRARYRNFTRSYATGGNEITFYEWTGHNDDYVVRTFCHEAGHYIDRQNMDVSGSQQWDDARTADMQATGHSSPTSYGNNSNAEDFAESVAEWATNRSSFMVEYAHRAQILASLIT